MVSENEEDRWEDDGGLPLGGSPLAELAARGLELGALGWYPDAETVVAWLARDTRATVKRTASVLSITSPRQPVKSNVKLARAVLRGWHPVLLPSVGAALTHFQRTGVIRGAKTSAFARALTGDRFAVVLDTHMLDALGEPRRVTPSRYAHLTERVTRAARELGIAPREAQAAIWVAQRERRGLRPALFSDALKRP